MFPAGTVVKKVFIMRSAKIPTSETRSFYHSLGKRRSRTAAVLAVFLLAVMAIGVFPLASDTTDADHSDTRIDLNATLANQSFANWSSDSTGNVFTIDGNVTLVGALYNVTSQRTFNIASGATVRWEATYSGTPSNVIRVTGAGTLEIVGGGTVSSSTGSAVYTSGSSSLIVNGGTLSSVTDNAIFATGTSSVTVNGGTVSSDSNRAIYAASDSTVTVNGGTVSSTSNSAIAAANNSTVNVNGGTVFSMSDYVVSAFGTSTLTANGGFILSYGTNLSSMISAPPSGNSILAAWDSSGGTSVFGEGSKTGLRSFPDAATVVWHNDDVLGGGIFYKNGTNTGFFPIAGVTVDPMTYSVTVNGGTGSGNYAEGETVTIEAATPEGKLFKQWNISPEVTFTEGSAASPTAKFAMIGEDVTADAVYENESGGNILLYVAIIVIVVLLALFVVYFLFFRGKLGRP